MYSKAFQYRAFWSVCDMNAYPFSVFKRTDRPSFLVSFKDADGKFLSPVSTKKTTEKEAMTYIHFFTYRF